MPNPNPNPEGAEETKETDAPKAPEADVFGVTLNPDGTEVQPEEKKEEAPELDKDGKPVEKKEEKKETETEKSAEVIALEAKVADYSKNLTGQNDVIAKLQSQIADLIKGGGKKDGEDKEVLFKDIKTSKDLTAEQREDMTDTEIALFDQNALQQQAMNKMFESIQGQSKQVEDTKKETEDAKVEDLNSSAKTEATKLADEAIKTNPELATDAKALTDLIIVEFNEFNNAGISQEKLVERMKKALNNVSGYTPPKEQEKKPTGKNPVKNGAGSETDPFGVDAIVAGVKKENDGDYNL